MRAFAHWLGIAAIAAAAAAAARVDAGVPLPSLTFYGMLVDEFGWPYPSDDYVEIYADGTKVLAQTLSPAAGKQYNFIARIPYDSGGKLGDYSPDVISPGDNVVVNLVDNGTGMTVISTNFICNLPPGSVINFNLSSGKDSVGDGLPDALRQWIWNALGNGLPFNPADVHASDDSDGDGVSNLNEYLAGTDPTNPDDVLKVAIAPTAYSNVAQLTFFAVPGKSYQLQRGAQTPDGVQWNPAQFSSSPSVGADKLTVIGTGHLLSIFVPVENDANLFRLSVTSPTGTRILP